ncbi:hypothetical protein ACFL1V_07920 [Pseudomonadota bacterium]
MGKGIYWIILIAVGVFFGIFAHDRYEAYQTQMALQQFIEQQQTILVKEKEGQKEAKQRQGQSRNASNRKDWNKIHFAR